MTDPSGTKQQQDTFPPYDSQVTPDANQVGVAEHSVGAGTKTVGSQAPRRKTVAVLVCHGMGQQIQFETIEAVATAVKKAAEQSGTETEGISVSLHPSDDRFLGRAELTLHEGNDRVIAHFYEAYWAPLTEGKVSLWQSLRFLRDAGLRGLRFAYRDGAFDRWMFGERHQFAIPAERVLQLGLTLSLLLLIMAAFFTLALLPVLKLVDLVRGVTTAGLDFTAAVSYSVALAVVIELVLGGFAAYILRTFREEPAPALGRPSRVPSVFKRSVMVLVTAAVIGAGLWLSYFLGLRIYSQWLVPVVADPLAHPFGLAFAIVAFVAEFFLLRMLLQRFLVQFVGDVAAYISPFKVSTFEEIRRSIQDRTRVVAKFIFESTNPVYDEVYFVGHSLGSVIAYDSLNDCVNRDTIAGAWSPGSKAGDRNVIAKTKLLLTFGSPLDKTAFIFRTQKRAARADVREKLAGLTQAIIADEAKRPPHWVNLWSPNDWISGRLSYYDSPKLPEDKLVANLQNRFSLRPWKAHTRYWTDPLLRGVLYTAMTGKPALNLSTEEAEAVDPLFGIRAGVRAKAEETRVAEESKKRRAAEVV